jgi:hypothetical protein
MRFARSDGYTRPMSVIVCTVSLTRPRSTSDYNEAEAQADPTADIVFIASLPS